MKKIGFIDYYLDEWHANNLPQWIEKVSQGAVKVCYAWAEIDSPLAEGKTSQEWAKETGVTLCDSQEAVIAQSDYLVVLSPDNPERHEDLCRLALSSGKPTYVDKTFSVGAADAERIIAYAKASGTPFFSCSSLRYDTEIQARMGREIVMMNSFGPGSANYMVHQMEPIFMLMGGRAQRVMALGEAGTPTLLLDFGEKRRAVMSFCDWDTGFGCTLLHAGGKCESFKIESDYFTAFTEVMLKFFETKESPVCADDTHAIMAMIEAGLAAAQNPGVWVVL